MKIRNRYSKQYLSRRIPFVHPLAKVDVIVGTMRDHDCDYCLVVDKKDRMVGIITNDDIVFHVFYSAKIPEVLCAGEIMSIEPVSISEDASVDELLQTFSEYKISHLPILSQEQVVGVITLKDVVASLVK